MWGHNYHFHIRLRCPADNPDCKPQDPPGHGDGCGADLDWWFRDAAREPSVQRIFVNAAIKKALCREAKGDRGWLSKVRPMYGHDYHFHIRIKCPPGSGGECERQPDPSEGEGCSAGDLAYWFKDSVIHPKPPKAPPKPKPPMTLAQLPAACRQVLAAPDAKQ